MTTSPLVFPSAPLWSALVVACGSDLTNFPSFALRVSVCVGACRSDMEVIQICCSTVCQLLVDVVGLEEILLEGA